MKRKIIMVLITCLALFGYGCTSTSSESKSEEVKPVVDNPIELTIQADAEKIAADGEDFSTINITGKYQSGKSIEEKEIELYCNDTKTESKKLFTTNAGIYVLYGKSGTIKSNTITISAISLKGIKWKTVNERFTSPSLLDNKIGFDGVKDINVCLPPAYDLSSKNRKFPVVYFLAGYDENSLYDINMFRFNTTINSAFEKGTTRNIVYVFLNGKHKLGGSFYVNSAMGKWEDYVYKDVVELVESKYNVKKDAASRGIAGHSMGGYGALYIAMRHPDIFGAVYCTSPGISDPEKPSSGIERVFLPTGNRTAKITAYNNITATYLNDPTVFSDKIVSLFNSWGWAGVEATYGMAFAQDDKPPYFKYPYSLNGSEIVKDEALYKTWNLGYGGIALGVKNYKENLKKLRGIRIDYGINDEYVFVPEGSKYLDKVFKEEGIEATIQGNSGNHESKTYEWAENYMYPFFSEKLK